MTFHRDQQLSASVGKKPFRICTGCFSVAVVVIDAPGAIHVVELTGGAVVFVLTRNHAFVEERDDRAVVLHVGITRIENTLWLRIAVAVSDDIH